MALTTIQWTQRQRPDGSWMPGYTFNPWWGCVEISPACDHCYARTSANRWGFGVWGPHAPRRFFGDKHWNDPVKWNRDALRLGEHHLVFSASMADIFERLKTDPELGGKLDRERERLFRLVEQTRNLTWLLLTKRTDNILDMVPKAWLSGFPENVWMGATTEDQTNHDRRSVQLEQCPSKVRFLSYEPALGSVDFSRSLSRGVDWIIVGGESGGKARPLDLSDVASTIAQCDAAGKAVFVKQLGARPVGAGLSGVKLKDPAGGDVSEWPESFRRRHFPAAA